MVLCVVCCALICFVLIGFGGLACLVAGFDLLLCLVFGGLPLVACSCLGLLLGIVVCLFGSCVDCFPTVYG